MGNDTGSQPLADFVPVPDGGVTSPLGFRAGGLHCGLKKNGGLDLGAIVCDVPAAAAAVYTTNRFQAAPLAVTRESLAQEGRLRAVVVNSGNANACTGRQGEEDARAMRAALAAVLGAPEHHVAVASTGVIGVPLSMASVRSGIERLKDRLAADAEGAKAFSEAIMTTDTVRKTACVRVELDGRTVTVAGAAKGAGMIHPNMATMLAFITTDAAVSPSVLQDLLKETADGTFNMITVDGDTSTNDMVLAMASGLAGNAEITRGHPGYAAFAAAFRHVCEELAKAIARDGEGATKLIEVCVAGAASDESARVIARTVASSSLVKTAVFGADANWGRIVAAVGRAGQPVNPETVDVRLGDIVTLEQSRPVPFDEEAALAYLKGDTVRIYIDLHMGSGRATAWGCDLTYDYVRINADYRT